MRYGTRSFNTKHAGAYAAYTRALAGAYEDRLSTMGDNENPAAPASTTHFSIVGRDGTIVYKLVGPVTPANFDNVLKVEIEKALAGS